MLSSGAVFADLLGSFLYRDLTCVCRNLGMSDWKPGLLSVDVGYIAVAWKNSVTTRGESHFEYQPTWAVGHVE